jgi:hypothetical protein
MLQYILCYKYKHHCLPSIYLHLSLPLGPSAFRRRPFGLGLYSSTRSPYPSVVHPRDRWMEVSRFWMLPRSDTGCCSG